MSTELVVAGILIFFAAFLAVEALYLWWNSTRSAEARRMSERLDSLTSLETSDNENVIRPLQKQRVDPNSFEGQLISIPATRWLRQLLLESGSGMTVTSFLTMVLLSGLGATFLAMLFRFAPVVTIAAGILFLVIPFFVLSFLRSRRQKKIENQLPTALDMIGRALRAGHSFSSAMNVAGEELSEPLGPEFKVTFNEINYGIPPAVALQNLAARVPSTDLGYFVIAVLIQRESGGNLTEVLDNIAALIRERLKLYGKVRALSAEGRYSAILLTLLPFVAGWLFYTLNPKMMELLWTEDVGIKMIYAGLIMMFVGIIWMRKVIRIHV